MSRVGKLLYIFSALSLLSFAVIWYIMKSWVPYLGVALGLTIVFLLATFIVDRHFYKEFFTLKTTKNGMSMGATIMLVFVLLVGVNFISVRKYKTFDFSATKVNSLSDQSIKILDGLKEELKVIYFYKKGSEGIEEKRRAFMDLLKKYQDRSSLVKLEFVEVNSRPDLANEYGVNSGVEAVFLEYQKRKNKIEKIDEQELTSAIVKVTRETQKTVYFITGHGEFEASPSPDGSGLELLRNLLEGNRYQVRSYSFTQATQVPQDADMVFVIGPKQAYLDFEIKALEDYLKRGGSMVIALDPKNNAGLDGFLKKLGITPKNNFLATVVETPIGMAVEPRVVRGVEFGTHQIGKPFGKNQFTVFRMPQSLAKESAPAGVSLEDVVRTNQGSMAFESMKFDQEGARGPFSLAIAAKGKFPGADEKANEFNLVVFGSAALFTDQLLYQNLNRDLVLNTAAFLGKEENLISITPKDMAITKMELDQTKFAIFLFGLMIPLPVLLFIGSGVLWYRRRYS